MHAPIGVSAVNRGLHVYGQKPLAHDIYEVRRMTEIARAKKLHTQMGIQVHSGSEYRTACKAIQDGVIGKVKEVHTWSSKKWGDNGPMPAQTDAVPEGLNWDLWLGGQPPQDRRKLGLRRPAHRSRPPRQRRHALLAADPRLGRRRTEIHQRRRRQRIR